MKSSAIYTLNAYKKSCVTSILFQNLTVWPWKLLITWQNLPVKNNEYLHLLSSPHFVPRYFLFVLRVLPFMQSPVRGCRSRSTDDTRCLHHILFGNACISGKLLPFFFIYMYNKSQLLLHPYIPSHLINLKNQLRYRYWKLFCVRLLSSFVTFERSL